MTQDPSRIAAAHIPSFENVMNIVGHIGIIADDPTTTRVHTYDGPLIMTPLLRDKVERYRAVLEPVELVHWFDQQGEEAMALALAMIDAIPEGHCSGFVMSATKLSDTLIDIYVEWLDDEVAASDAEAVVAAAMDRVDAAIAQRRGANGW